MMGAKKVYRAAYNWLESVMKEANTPNKILDEDWLVKRLEIGEAEASRFESSEEKKLYRSLIMSNYVYVYEIITVGSQTL